MKMEVRVLFATLILLALSMAIVASGVAAQQATVSSEDVTISNSGGTGSSVITVDADSGVGIANVEVSIDTSVAEIKSVRAGADVDESDAAVTFNVVNQTPDSARIEYNNIGASSDSVTDFELAVVEFEAQTDDAETMIGLAEGGIFDGNTNEYISVGEEEGTFVVDAGSGGSGIDDIQTTLTDESGDGLEDRVEVDVTVSSVSSGQTTVELGETNFDVDVSPTDTTDGNQEQSVTPQDTDGDGTNEAVDFVDVGTINSATYTVIADLSGQSDGETGSVEVTLGGGATDSTTYTVQSGGGNPFFDANGNVVSRQTVINRIVEWNLNGSIDGTSYTRSEIINFVVEWNLAS